MLMKFSSKITPKQPEDDQENKEVPNLEIKDIF